MGERTQLEKQCFGKIITLEAGQSLTEDKVDWVIDQFIKKGVYFELVTSVVERTRDRVLT